MLSEYKLKIADLCNILNENVKKLVLNLFLKKDYIIQHENLKLYLRLELKIERYITYYDSINDNSYNVILNSISKEIEADEKKQSKDGKALSKLRNNAVYGKTMENFRNSIGMKLDNNKKDYLKYTSKPI